VPAEIAEPGAWKKLNEILLNDKNYISEEELHEIDQYLNEELSPTARRDFEQRMQGNEAFASTVNEMKLLTLGVQEVNLKAKLNEFHSTLQKPARIIPLVRKIAAAAAILILIGLPAYYFTMRKSATEKLYSDYYKPDPGLVTAMGNSANYQFEKAMVAYKERDYETAIKSWSVLTSQQPTNDTLQYFLGAAYQATDKNELAIEQLQKVTQQKESAFYKDACWYLGLALMKQKQIAKAKEYINLSGHSQRTELLEDLNKN
jgi:tetratricopeptide (TPR) repeat protein